MVRTFDYHCYISPLFCCTLHTSANAAFFTTCNWILCVWLNDFELCSGATERSLTHFLCCALIHESHGPYCMSSAWLSATFFFFFTKWRQAKLLYVCVCANVWYSALTFRGLGDQSQQPWEASAETQGEGHRWRLAQPRRSGAPRQPLSSSWTSQAHQPEEEQRWRCSLIHRSPACCCT